MKNFCPNPECLSRSLEAVTPAAKAAMQEALCTFCGTQRIKVMSKGDTVMYREVIDPSDATAQYIVLETPTPGDENDRIKIRYICDLPFAPVSVAAVKDLKVIVDYEEQRAPIVAEMIARRPELIALAKKQGSGAVSIKLKSDNLEYVYRTAGKYGNPPRRQKAHWYLTGQLRGLQVIIPAEEFING